MLWTVGPSEVREVPGSLWMMQLQERRLEAGGVVRKPGSCPGTGEPGAQDRDGILLLSVCVGVGSGRGVGE